MWTRWFFVFCSFLFLFVFVLGGGGVGGFWGGGKGEGSRRGFFLGLKYWKIPELKEGVGRFLG